jgi:virginiamycin B lyase
MLARCLLLGIVCAIALPLAASAGASAVEIADYPATDTSVPGAHVLQYIKTGVDGSMWFTDSGTAGGVGRVKLTGELLPAIYTTAPALDLAVGPNYTFWTQPDGSLAHERNSSGMVSNASGASYKYFTATVDPTVGWGHFGGHWAGGNSQSFCTESFSGGGGCSGGVTTASNTPATATQYGPDGDIWSVASDDDRIFHSATVGGTAFSPVYGTPKIVVLAPGSQPIRIAAGPDGNMWVTDHKTSMIERVSPDGSHTAIALPAGRGPRDIASGPGGAMWFTETDANMIGCVNMAGEIAEIAVPTPNSKPWGIAAGPDGAVWFTEQASGKVGRLLPTDGCPIFRPDVTTPVFTSKLTVSNGKFRVGKAPTLLIARASKKPPTGTSFSYSLSEAATVQIAVAQLVGGRKSGSTCVKLTNKNRKAKRCSRSSVKATIVRGAASGANVLVFSGRIGNRSLKPGRYLATATATDAAGNASTASTTAFKIVR